MLLSWRRSSTSRPPRPNLVPRPRLAERLEQGLAGRLILVSGPAGFGKTTLLAEWIADCGFMTIFNQRITELEELASRILAQEPEEVVRYRLLRDVLRKPAGDLELAQAKEGLDKSRCVQELADEQWADGGWGAFHSRSTRLKQKIPSTEVGVERALALGLDASRPILRQAAEYIVGIMGGKVAFPDYQEKNDRWPTGRRLFLASTLSLIQPDHPLLAEDRALWLEIARRTFRSGRYSAEEEIRAHAELTGATVKDSYLVLNGRYQLNILGSLPGMLPRELEVSLLSWLWERPDGIGYLEMPLNCPPPYQKPGPLDRWLASLEMLARLFPAWVEFAQEAMEWLWPQRDEQGYWDFGPQPGSGSYLPLSSSWRTRPKRLVNWTTRVLVLLRRYCD